MIKIDRISLASHKNFLSFPCTCITFLHFYYHSLFLFPSSNMCCTAFALCMQQQTSAFALPGQTFSSRLSCLSWSMERQQWQHLAHGSMASFTSCHVSCHIWHSCLPGFALLNIPFVYSIMSLPVNSGQTALFSTRLAKLACASRILASTHTAKHAYIHFLTNSETTKQNIWHL